MSSSTLGRRYERLLFLAAPLSLASLLLLFVATATTSQQERIAGRCYDAVAAALEAKNGDLIVAWDATKPVTKSPYWGADYKFAVQKVVIYARLGTHCYNTIYKQIDRRYRQSPTEMISSLKQDAISIAKLPLEFRGVELPDRATLGLMGTTIKIELMTFVRVLQVVLAPLMILWLGSLYNTRYRESLLIGSAKLVSDVFPHVINVYPAVGYPQPRKKSWVQYHLQSIFALVYAGIRIALLLLFIAPPVAAYIASLFLLDSDEYRYLFMAMGLVVAIFAFTNTIAEFLPWHYKKVFPGPPMGASRES
jgi:hypothetical protein